MRCILIILHAWREMPPRVGENINCFTAANIVERQSPIVDKQMAYYLAPKYMGAVLILLQG